MGGKKSKPAEPESPLLDKPWREINWSQNTKGDLEYVIDHRSHTDGQQLRFLLYGPVRAGKSSFINSVQSVLKGRMCTLALADNTAHGCFTKEYTTYKIRKEGPDSFYPFVFSDTMGLDPKRGVLVDDIKLAFTGHVKEGYVFNPEYKLSEGNAFYKKSPTVNDKVHVVVCVVPADMSVSTADETGQKIRDVRLEASRLGIPQVVVFTRIEEACPEIKAGLKNVYRSKQLKQKMQQFSADMGIPMNCMFPVKNYYEEINLNNDCDALILNALRHIIDYGEDFISRKTV